MKRIRGVVLLLLLSAALPARAEGPALLPGLESFEGPGQWRLGGTVLWTTSAVLDRALSFGASVEGFRRLGTGPLLVGARLAFARNTESNQDWVLRHDHFSASALVRLERSSGVGMVFGQLGAGVMPIFEKAQRHQYERLKAVGAKDLERTSWSLGPLGFLELGAAVRVRGGLSASISAGPNVTAQTVNGAMKTRFGFQSTLGVSHAF